MEPEIRELGAAVVVANATLDSKEIELHRQTNRRGPHGMGQSGTGQPAQKEQFAKNKGVYCTGLEHESEESRIAMWVYNIEDETDINGAALGALDSNLLVTCVSKYWIPPTWVASFLPFAEEYVEYSPLGFKRESTTAGFFYLFQAT